MWASPHGYFVLTFIEATDDDQADRGLTRLIDEHAARIGKEILGSSLRIHVDISGIGSSSQDSGDLFNVTIQPID